MRSKVICILTPAPGRWRLIFPMRFTGRLPRLGQAGQEVARWFLRVGAASGTVAKTISAYDKTFSDQVYGVGTRYVSRERLLAMLDHEFELLQQRLGKTRGAATTFFAFADTVAARNFKGDNQQHGWVGLRFQGTPLGEPNDILLHVNLVDPTADQQQESLGILGVNLIYGAFRQRQSSTALLAALFTGLTRQKLEVDVVEVRGPALAGLSTELCSLEAVCRGMGHAVVFDEAGHVTEPATVLRKKALIVERGRFKALEPHNRALLETAMRHVQAQDGPAQADPHAVVETTVLESDGQRVAGPDVILERVRRMQALGPVIVSDFPQNYLLVDYLRRFTSERIHFVVGVSTLARVFDPQRYRDLPGGLLEGIGKMLAKNVRILAYPMPKAEFLAAVGAVAGDLEPLAAGVELVTAGDVRLKPPVSFLYRYVRDAGWIGEL